MAAKQNKLPARFSFSTNAFTRVNLNQALEQIAGCGFSTVEILADSPHAYAAEMTPRKISALRRQLDALDLTVGSLNANTASGFFSEPSPEPIFEPSLISPQSDWRSFRLDYTRRAIDLAAALGSSMITLTSGRLLGGVNPGRARDLLLLGLEALLLHAERAGGVRIGIESEPGLFIENAAELAELIERLDHPLLGSNLDLGHVYVGGGSLSGATKTLAGRIWNVHLEDLPGRKHYHLAPGEGSFPFAMAKKALADINYRGTITWEIYTAIDDPESACRKAFQFSRKIWPRLNR